MQSRLDKAKVVECFQKMDFGDAKYCTKLADKWLAERFQHNEAAEAITNVLTNKPVFAVDCNKKCATIKDVSYEDSLEKLSVFTEIINVLKANTELLVQLEICIRGISPKDTTKNLKLFFDYLSFYSLSSSICVGMQLQVHCGDAISMLGFYLGRLLSASKHILLKCDVKVYPLVRAIKELIETHCAKYHVHIDLEASKLEETNSIRTPVVIFNDADIDSACEAVIKAAYAEQGQMPWSTNTVLVQEDILADAVGRFKRRLTAARFGAADDKHADFAYPCHLGDYEADYKSVVSAAIAKGLEVFPVNHDEGFRCTLLVGGKLYSNNALTPNDVHVPYINIIAFRTAKEAVALCNNQRQTFAAGVWSRNACLLNEIVHQLQVNTVWTNAHAVFEASVPFAFSRDTFTFVGGLESLCYYPIVDRNANAKGLSSLRDAQAGWAKKSREERVRALIELAKKLDITLDASVDKNYARKWIDLLLQYPAREALSIRVQVHGAHELKQFKEPQGIVAYLISDTDDKGNVERNIVSALLNGNSVFASCSDDRLRKVLAAIATHTGGLIAVDSQLLADVPHVFIQNDASTNADIPATAFCRLKNVWSSIGDVYV